MAPSHCVHVAVSRSGGTSVTVAKSRSNKWPRGEISRQQGDRQRTSLERTAKMINAIAAHPRETDSRHHPMACLLAAGGPAMAPRWRNGGHEWLRASDRGLACPVLGVFQTVETPLPQASISLAFRRGTGPMVARFLCGRRGQVREVQCGSPGASQPRRRVNGRRVLTFFCNREAR
jgi:hypothetical protein